MVKETLTWGLHVHPRTGRSQHVGLPGRWSGSWVCLMWFCVCLLFYKIQCLPLLMGESNQKNVLLNEMSRSEKLCREFLISFRLWRMDQNRISSLRSRLSDFAVWSESALDQSPHRRLSWWKEIISLWNKRSCASFFFSVKAFVRLSDQIQGIKAAF